MRLHTTPWPTWTTQQYPAWDKFAIALASDAHAAVPVPA
jgi:hypothetical protein